MKKKYYIKKKKEFNKIFLNKKSFANKKFVIYILKKKNIYFHFGIFVSKKNGNSVIRNYLKRRIRVGIFKLKNKIISNFDFIIIVRFYGKKEFNEIFRNLKHLLLISKILRK